jgi:hypothetical protein
MDINNIPDVLIALAYAAKNIDKTPVLGNKAAWVFRNLFTEKERKRVIDALVDNHPEPQLYKEALERELS